MSEIAIYHHLIYYRYYKLFNHLTFAYLFLTYFITSLSIFKHVLEQQVKDLIVIGEGPFCNHLIETLGNRNLTYHHVTIPRCPTLTINNIKKQTSQVITFPICEPEEIEYLSAFVDCSIEEVLIAQERLLQNQLKHQDTDDFPNSRELYQYNLPQYIGTNHRSYVREIRKDRNLNFVTLDNLTLVGRMVCLVDINDIRLAEEYLDLDNPISIRLKHTIERGETDNNVYVVSDQQRIIASGKEVTTFKDTDVYYDKVTGRYIYNNQDNMEPERIFFRPKSNNFLILDPLNYPTSSPERDVLIIIDIVTKMLISN